MQSDIELLFLEVVRIWQARPLYAKDGSLKVSQWLEDTWHPLMDRCNALATSLSNEDIEMSTGPSGSLYELELKLLMLKLIERWDKDKKKRIGQIASPVIRKWLREDLKPVIDEMRKVINAN